MCSKLRWFLLPLLAVLLELQSLRPGLVRLDGHRQRLGTKPLPTRKWLLTCAAIICAGPTETGGIGLGSHPGAAVCQHRIWKSVSQVKRYWLAQVFQGRVAHWCQRFK